MRQTDNRLTCCIAITTRDTVYLYQTPDNITLVDSARDLEREWSGFEHFSSQSAKEIFALAVNLGYRLEFTKGDKHDLAMEVWGILCEEADDRRAAVVPTGRHPLSGKKLGRKKQDLSARRYIVTEQIKGMVARGERKEAIAHCPCPTRQAKKIWEFFVDEVIATKLLAVTEGRMQDVVNDRAEELYTKQDPWRIFQYYRPELIQCKLIKLVKEK